MIEKGNIKARVCEWGNKGNPAIVCLHGLGSINLSFIEIAEALKDDYYIISIDLPGHGKTPAFKNDEDYGIPYLTAWLSEVIKLMDIDKFYLLAHSWGGCIAFHYAARYPNQVKKILSIDGGYHIKSISNEYWRNSDTKDLGYKPTCSLEEEIKFYEEDFDGSTFSNLEDALTCARKCYSRLSDLLEIESRETIIEEPSGVFRWHAKGYICRGIFTSMYNYPTDVIYAKLDMPVLLLEAMLPESSVELRDIMVDIFAKNVKNGVVKKVNTSHMVHFDNPELVIKEAREWFK